MSEDRELEWEDEFLDDTPEFTVLKEGKAFFEVKSVDKARHIAKPGAKLPDCNKAVVNLRVYREGEGETHISSSFFLHTKCKGFISEFFESVGLHSRGDKLRMRWGDVPGLKGECQVEIRRWTRDNGESGEINEVKKFYRHSQTSQQLSEPQSQMQRPSFQAPVENTGLSLDSF